MILHRGEPGLKAKALNENGLGIVEDKLGEWIAVRAPSARYLQNHHIHVKIHLGVAGLAGEEGLSMRCMKSRFATDVHNSRCRG